VYHPAHANFASSLTVMSTRSSISSKPARRSSFRPPDRRLCACPRRRRLIQPCACLRRRRLARPHARPCAFPRRRLHARLPAAAVDRHPALVIAAPSMRSRSQLSPPSLRPRPCDRRFGSGALARIDIWLPALSVTLGASPCPPGRRRFRPAWSSAWEHTRPGPIQVPWRRGRLNGHL
jgi:hypothetical protein